jgi:hypothetical protein
MLETTAYVLGLLSDYVFPSCPPTFDWYPSNAGDLSTPLFELHVLDYSRRTLSVQPCRADSSLRDYKLFKRITLGLRPSMAMNNSLLGRHLSSVAGKHLCFVMFSVANQAKCISCRFGK